MIQQSLILYIIFQSLFFSVVLIFRRKSEDRELTFYFTYLFLFHFFFMLYNNDFLFNSSKSEFIRISYETIALCNSAIVFSFLYSILFCYCIYCFRLQTEDCIHLIRQCLFIRRHIII